jgi:hypothetical protein
MRIPGFLALLTAAGLSSIALAQPQVTGAISTEPGKGTAVSIVTANATVQSVDPRRVRSC